MSQINLNMERCLPLLLAILFSMATVIPRATLLVIIFFTAPPSLLKKDGAVKNLYKFLSFLPRDELK